MASKKRTHETLEFEDEDARFKRLQSTLEKLNTNTSPLAAPNPFPLPTERTRPHAMPTSDLLARVQAFLPDLEASNAVLEQQRQADPTSVDIENVEDNAERYIEMNLGLGLFEQRGKDDSGRGPAEIDDDSTSSDSSSDSDSDDDDDSNDEGPTNVHAPSG